MKVSAGEFLSFALICFAMILGIMYSISTL